jgi:hypothetical protein
MITKSLDELMSGHPDMPVVHPRIEHFLPFVIGLALLDERDSVERIDEPGVI